MSKEKFLEILSRSLEGEVEQKVIDENIKYYNNYISSKSKKEEKKIIEKLGEPTHIAKTIIEKDIARRKSDRASRYRNFDDYVNDQYRRNNMNQIKIKWYHYLIIIFVLFVVLMLTLSIGRILFRFFFRFALPIIALIFIIRILRNL